MSPDQEEPQLWLTEMSQGLISQAHASSVDKKSDMDIHGLSKSALTSFDSVCKEHMTQHEMCSYQRTLTR
jgi:hypothetical protein